MATIPVAKPSKPSIRFIALANSTTHKTVANAARSGVSNTTSTKGILRTTKETPTSDKTLPAMTIPAIFAGAVIGFTSSITPTAHITTADKRTPNISDCEEKSAEISMALIEACINAFEHSGSNKQIEIHFRIKEELLEIQVTDKGKGFDESKVSIPKIEEKIVSDRKRGWGLQLIKELMDTVEFESSTEGTTVTMTKKK